MRKLKFRAWDKIGEKFLFPYPEGFHILGETTCFDLLMNQMYENHPEHRPTLMMLNDVEITQFTGLTDKNDKEIYESDRVRAFDTESRKYIEGIVKWRGDYYFWGVDNILFDELEELEVIGNIYEN